MVAQAHRRHGNVPPRWLSTAQQGGSREQGTAQYLCPAPGAWRYTVPAPRTSLPPTTSRHLFSSAAQCRHRLVSGSATALRCWPVPPAGLPLCTRHQLALCDAPALTVATDKTWCSAAD